MKKGITLAILSIIILLMIILVTTIVTTGTMAINNSRKIKFASEIALVQEMSDEYANNNNGQYPVSSSLEIDLKNVTTVAIKQFDGETKNASSIILYKIDFSLLGKTDLMYGTSQNGDTTDVYAISKETGRVYYVKGLKAGKNTYYTLTDDLKDGIDYNPNVGSVTKDGIVFNTVKSEWTNKNVDSVVKVPSNLEYTNVVVSVLKDGNLVSTVRVTENKQNYDIYNIKNVSGNYEIKVEYTKDRANLSQTFNVTNFDSNAPEIIVKDTKQMVNEKDNIKQTYISIDIENDISGIKYSKYETDLINEEDAKLYFSNNGMQIKDKTIVVDRYTTYVTIYIEDNAGNYSSQIVQLNNILNENDYVKDGLVLQYDGINNTGNGHSNTETVWKDLSGNGNDGTLVGIDGNYDSGWKDEALRLDGINDYVYKNMGIDRYNSTIEVVYKYSDGSNVFASDINEYLSIDSKVNLKDNQIATLNKESAINACIVFNKISQDRGSMQVFENSRFISETSSNIASGKYIILGANEINNPSQFAKADIYAIRIYNRVLTQEEINQNYKIDRFRFRI